MHSSTDKTVVRITRLEDESGEDLTYWRSQSYYQRLMALEEIRSEYNNWKYGAEQRLQRVYRITRFE